MIFTKSWYDVCMSKYKDRMTPETIAIFETAQSTYVSKDIDDTIQCADHDLAREHNSGWVLKQKFDKFYLGDLVGRRDIRKFYKVKQIIEVHSWSIGGVFHQDGVDPNKYGIRFDLILQSVDGKTCRIGSMGCLPISHYIKSAEKSIKKSNKWLLTLKATEIALKELTDETIPVGK